MQNTIDWEVRFREELRQAEAARAAGNEGKARVCARRAAGVVVEQYLRRRDVTLPRSSAYHSLNYLSSLPDISTQIKGIAAHFLVRITHEHTLPVDADLIEEARWLAKELLDHPHDGS